MIGTGFYAFEESIAGHTVPRDRPRPAQFDDLVETALLCTLGDQHPVDGIVAERRLQTRGVKRLSIGKLAAACQQRKPARRIGHPGIETQGLRQAHSGRAEVAKRFLHHRQVVAVHAVAPVLPHRLGKEEARRRIEAGLGRAKTEFKALIALEQETWSGDTLSFSARALGQRAAGTIAIYDGAVRLEVTLPWLLAKFAAAAIQALL